MLTQSKIRHALTTMLMEKERTYDAVRRKRALRPSEKAMWMAELMEHQQVLRHLLDRIKAGEP